MIGELNLINKEKSDLQYDVITFPDGHVHLDLSKCAIPLASVTELTITTRLTNMDDLFMLMQAMNVINHRNPNCHVDLRVTYLIGARYDRRMYDGDSFDLKIISGLINDMAFDGIRVIEPHSPTTLALLDRAEAFNPFDMWSMAHVNAFASEGEVIIIAPDLGAVKRCERYASAWTIPKKIAYANKKRNLKTGEILGLELITDLDMNGKVCVIYDDLCDGGRTFIETAKLLKNRGSKKVVLVVTHGIFSKGYEPLLEGGIDHIITSNSYADHVTNDSVRVIDVS